MIDYAQSQGALSLNRKLNPILNQENGILVKVAPSIVCKAEPVLQSVVEYTRGPSVPSKTKTHFDSLGRPITSAGLFISIFKALGPENIKSFFDLMIALFVFWYIFLVSRIFRVDGYRIVDRPKFSKEYESIHSYVTVKGEKDQGKKLK